jgi:protein-tyrosine phosphatase
VDLDVGSLPERVREVGDRLRSERVPMSVRCGGELASDSLWRLSQRELELIAQGPPGRRWPLLEAPLTGLDDAFSAAALELRARGFGIVVAHPERSLGSAPAGRQILDELARLHDPDPRRRTATIPNLLLDRGLPPRSRVVAA